MMMPAFGFSVGDFIAVIGLCTKVAKALQSSSGVASEYQQVIIEIEGLQDALTRLVALEPTESNIDHVNAIRRMALACRLPMQDFLSKMGKYEAAMSPFANRKSVRSAGKKAEYAVFMSEEVKTMRAMISGKVISINLLLGTHASETLSRTEGQLSANQENLLARLAEAKNGMNSIRQDIASMNTATSTSQEQLREDILNSTSHLTDQLGQVNNDTASTKRNISALATGVGSISTSITTLLGLGTQILSILRVFPAELRALLQNVVRTNVQMYAVLLEVQRKISASPTLALESNIRIEDALGEIRSLPYEWFRHWEPFEGLLRAEFKNRLGSERVERGEFRLVHTKQPTLSMDENNWSRTIVAGADIVMLMLITDLACQESSCPRLSCDGRTAMGTERQTMLTCPKCGLRFIPQLTLPESTEANMIEQLQLEEDERLFGTRSKPGAQTINNVDMKEQLTHENTQGITYDIRSGERLITGYNSNTDPPALDQMNTKREISPNAKETPSDPPIYAWLNDTESPKDPISVLRWREEEEVSRVKRQKQDAQDLEVFRNVEIALPLKDDVPTHDVQDSILMSHTGPATGAYMLYRNILDQYPKLDEPLAWRFANGNWRRMEDFQRKKHEDMALMQGQTDYLERQTRISTWESEDESDLPPFGATHFRKSWKPRKTCSLPPPPRLVRERHSKTGYSAKCHICHQTIRLRCKRDWSNHVMDDLLPYMCPISDCASGHMMFVRRQHLEVHLRTRHPLESCQQCPFCDKNIELDSTKHMGHHMEEIAFGVLTTAYEEWSYDDTNSEASIPVVHTKSPPRRTFFCTGYPPCQRSFFNIEILARHIRTHTGKGSLKCNYCDVRFTRTWNLRSHIRAVHGGDAPPPSMSPKEKEELEMVEFLQQMSKELDWQVETIEAEVELLQGKKGNANAERLEELEDTTERHKWHIGKLELLQRALKTPNTNVTTGEVKEVEEDIRYYVENNQEPDFMEDDTLYDDFNLVEEEVGDNYWTHSSHPSSSASSINSQLRYSVSELQANDPVLHKNALSRCKVCGKPFNDRRSLTLHMRIDHLGSLLVCDIDGCGSQFITEDDLHRHQRLHGKGTEFSEAVEDLESAIESDTGSEDEEAITDDQTSSDWESSVASVASVAAESSSEARRASA